MRSIFVSYWSIIQSMTLIYQIVLQIHVSLDHEIKVTDPCYILCGQSLYHTDQLSKIYRYIKKITGPLNIGHWPMYFYEVNLCVTRIYYPKYDLRLSNSFQDIRQNHWTMKYRSLTYIYFMRSIFVPHWPIIPSMTFIHQTVFKISGKIDQSWNIGKSDLHLMTWKAGSYGWLTSDLMS